MNYIEKMGRIYRIEGVQLISIKLYWH